MAEQHVEAFVFGLKTEASNNGCFYVQLERSKYFTHTVLFLNISHENQAVLIFDNVQYKQTYI